MSFADRAFYKHLNKVPKATMSTLGASAAEGVFVAKEEFDASVDERIKLRHKLIDHVAVTAPDLSVFVGELIMLDSPRGRNAWLKQQAAGRQKAEERLAEATREIERMKAELRTAARTTAPERDAAVTRNAVDRAVASACGERDAVIAQQQATIAAQRSEIDELKANKRKLREAIDRLKDGR